MWQLKISSFHKSQMELWRYVRRELAACGKWRYYTFHGWFESIPEADAEKQRLRHDRKRVAPNVSIEIVRGN
jgi:hypothetical protein